MLTFVFKNLQPTPHLQLLSVCLLFIDVLCAKGKCSVYTSGCPSSLESYMREIKYVKQAEWENKSVKTLLVLPHDNISADGWYIYFKSCF